MFLSKFGQRLFFKSHFHRRMENNQTNWKDTFNKTIETKALNVPTNLCSLVNKTFRGVMFEAPKYKPVVTNSYDPSRKYVILKENAMEVMGEKELKFIQDNNIKIDNYNVQLEFSNYTTEEALKMILPSELDTPTSFETIGHIAHLNLRENHEPYKHKIAQIILEKNPHIKTVVNKVGKIETQFRTFKMEVLAGIPNLETQVRESNCTFHFNFEDVYWNSRLQKEHERVFESFKVNEIICDVFAGVGPFSIPSAKKGCKVYANDLNPKSYHYLKTNVIKNKISNNNIECFNLDGRVFIKELIMGTITKNKEPVYPSHFVMNLPATAIEFLDVFKGLYSHLDNDGNSNNNNNIILPTVHCYGFSSAENPKEDIVKRIENVIGDKINPFNVHDVRDVAPKKLMLCVSFKLPLSVAVSPKKRRNDENIDEGSIVNQKKYKNQD